MNLLGKEFIETNKYKLEIEVSAEEFNKAVDNAYKKEGKNMSIQGFRKGKAPKAMIEKMYGETVFYDAAIDELYRPNVMEAVDASELEVISVGQMDIKEIGKDKPFVFTLEVTVKPEVSIEGYKGIEVTKSDVVVTDEEIDADIESTRDRNSRLVNVEDRAAVDGDSVVIDFDGYVDDVAFDGGKSENFTLVLGSGQFIPGFEEQVVGHNVGEEFDVNVSFPEEYHAEDLKGKAAVFKIKLHEIKVKELPELDDEFAKDVSEFDTLEEYKADVKARLERSKESAANSEVDVQIMDALAEKLEAVIPEEMNEQEINESINGFAYRLQSQGLDMDTYMKYTGLTPETIRDQFKEQAANSVKVRLALEKISALENIEVTEEEIEAEYAKLAETYSMPVENVKGMVGAENLKADLGNQKAVELVKAAVVFK